MKKLISLLVLGLAGCSAEQVASGNDPLGSVTCDAGMVAFNFTRFPNQSTAEAQSRSVDAGLNPYSLLRPNVVRITSATCNGAVSWAELFQDACEGRTECAFQRTDCRGADAATLQGPVRVTYACSATPTETKSLICNPPLKNCIFQMSCPPRATLIPPEAFPQRVECVPANCNGSTRRDENLQCVSDVARPVEYSWGYNEVLGQPERMAVVIKSSDVQMAYPAMRNLRGSTQLDLDITNIDYFNYPSAQPYFDRLKESALANHRILLAETLYDVKASVFYVVKPGEVNRGMKGTLALWIYDEYLVSAAMEKAFRCLMHSVDMSKYGLGTRVSADSNSYRIDINERFVVPKDCRDNGSTYQESQGVLYRARGWSAVDFGNRSTHVRGVLTASYDLEGRTILLDDFTEETRKLTCAVNPTDFFYVESAKTHHRYRFYAQREIGMVYQARPTGTFGQLEKIDNKLKHQGIFVQEANLTTLGLSAIRPKALEYKVRTVGPPRGFLRVDVDWYLSGDRHNYWVKTGLRDYPITLQTWLVPLDENDAPQPKNTHLNLGEARVYEANAYGETLSAKYAITEDLRVRFTQPGGTFEASKAGRKFKFRTCLKIGDGSLDFLEPPQYTLEINGADKCRTTDAPFLIKVDPSIAPLEPLGSDDLAESSPAGTGDGRMSQKQENDQDRDCQRLDGGVEICRTTGAADGEGEGSFGGSVLATDNSGYAGNGDVRVEREAELAGFQVLDDPEEADFETPGAKVSFTISPDWDAIAAALDRAIPGPRFEDEQFSGGVKGLSMGVEFKVPVNYGVLQGVVVYGVSVGVGLAVVFEYTLLPSRPAGCATDECDTIYKVMPGGSMNDVARSCYGASGRLADLRTETESTFLRSKIPAGGKAWIGGQVAEEYANPLCRGVWLGSTCVANHVTTFRWLADDEDFASTTGLGAFALDSAHVFIPSGGIPIVGVGGRPVSRGLTLSSDGTLEGRPLGESYVGICKLRNTASVTSHELKAGLEIVGAAGFSLAFCSPSDEFGVCLEGSFNILESKLIPSVTYTHHDLKDAAGRTGTQSNIKLSLDFEVHILSGALELKVVLGPWFSFSYNLFSFSGVKLPLGGNLAEKEYPLKEDFQ